MFYKICPETKWLITFGALKQNIIILSCRFGKNKMNLNLMFICYRFKTLNRNLLVILIYIVNPSPKNGDDNFVGFSWHIGHIWFLIFDDLIHMIKFHRSPDSIGRALCKCPPRCRIPLARSCSWIAKSNSFPESPLKTISPPNLK